MSSLLLWHFYHVFKGIPEDFINTTAWSSHGRSFTCFTQLSSTRYLWQPSPTHFTLQDPKEGVAQTQYQQHNNMPVLAEELTKYKAHRWQISCLAFNHDGSYLASGGWDKEVNIWDSSSLEPQRVHNLAGAHRVPVTCLCWHLPSKSRFLCVGSADNTATIWHAETGSRVGRLTEHSGWVLGACFSKSGSGSFLATSSWDHLVRIWDPHTETLINELRGHSAGVWDVDFHPKSSTLCTASEDGTVKLWDARTNRVVRTLTGGHTEGVYTAKWSPDGAVVASGSADTKICIWEPSTGSVINTIYGHIDIVKDIAFNPQTQNIAIPILASAGDYTVHISDPRPTQRADLLTLSPHLPGKEVEAVDISPDGSILVSGGRDGYLSLMTLFVPSLMPQQNQASIAHKLRASRHIRDRSYIYDATVDNISDVGSEVSEEDLEAEREMDELDSILTNRAKEASKISALAKMKRMSRLGEKDVDLPDHATVKRKGPSARASREKRVKEKAVDIPTMIAHLAAAPRAYGPEEPESSSGSESEEEEQKDKEDLLVKVSSRVSAFTGIGRKTSIQEAIQKPPPQRLSLLPDEVVGKLRDAKGMFEKSTIEEVVEEEEHEGKSDVESIQAPSESTMAAGIGDDEYYATLLPTELESPRHLARDDSMTFDDGESLMQSGNYSLGSPDYMLNSSLRFDDFTHNRDLVTSSPVDVSSPIHTSHAKQPFTPTLAPPLEEEAEDNFAEELGSGDEYGDDIPLSMI